MGHAQSSVKSSLPRGQSRIRDVQNSLSVRVESARESLSRASVVASSCPQRQPRACP